jgi:hypothetical protein
MAALSAMADGGWRLADGGGFLRFFFYKKLEIK